MQNSFYLHRHIEIVAAAGAEAPSEIVIFPDGNVEILGYDDAVVNKDTAAALIASFNDRGVKVPIDWEHSTKHKAGKGEPSPAAGWIGSLRYEKGAGIIAAVEWNDAAEKQIKDKQYKYLSPHFTVDAETGGPNMLLAVALTNTPRIKNMPELIAASAAAFGELTMKDKTVAASLTLSGAREKLQGIFKALCRRDVLAGDIATEAIPEDVTAAVYEISSAIGQIMAYMIGQGKCSGEESVKDVMGKVLSMLSAESASAETMAAVAAAAGLEKTASAADIAKAIHGLRTGTVDAGEYKKVADRLASLEAVEAERSVVTAIKGAIDARKLNPNNAKQVAAWTKIAKESPAQFASLVEASPELWIEGRIANTSANSPSDLGTRRKNFIAASAAEFDTEGRKYVSSRAAWVNTCLTQERMDKLNPDEAKSLEVAA